MDRRAFSGSLHHTLPAAEFDKVGKHSYNLQSIRTGAGFDELLGDDITCSTDYHGNRQEQYIKVRTNWKEKLKTFFSWAGKCSLEIYMIHGFLLNIFESSVPIKLLKQNKLLKKILSIRQKEKSYASKIVDCRNCSI